MKLVLWIGVISLFLSSGCSNPQLEQQYGDAITDWGIGCIGEDFASNEANRIICVVRNQVHPHMFLMIPKDHVERSFIESLGDTLAGVVTHGESGKSFYSAPEKWEVAADQFTRKYYGAKALIINFHYANEVGLEHAYVFEVIPGDQVPPWEEPKLQATKPTKVRTEVLDHPPSEH